MLFRSTRARALFETGLPTRWYLPREDIAAELEPSDLRTECAYKGVASYLSVRAGDALLENVAWTYPQPRHDAVKAAVAAFIDEATQAYSRRPTLTDTFLMFRSLPDRAEDRMRFLGSVERAVVALVLWDELSDASRAALLGRWDGIVDRIVTGEDV